METMTAAQQLAWEAWEGLDSQFPQWTHTDLSMQADRSERNSREAMEPKERTQGVAFRMLQVRMQGISGRLEQRLALSEVVRVFEGAAQTVIKDDGGDPNAKVMRDPDGAQQTVR